LVLHFPVFVIWSRIFRSSIFYSVAKMTIKSHARSGHQQQKHSINHNFLLVFCINCVCTLYLVCVRGIYRVYNAIQYARYGTVVQNGPPLAACPILCTVAERGMLQQNYVCLSAFLSVTLVYCVKNDKHIIIFSLSVSSPSFYFTTSPPPARTKPGRCHSVCLSVCSFVCLSPLPRSSRSGHCH